MKEGEDERGKYERGKEMILEKDEREEGKWIRTTIQGGIDRNEQKAGRGAV